MLRDRIAHYYLDQDYNCAESFIQAVNEYYDCGLPEGSHRLYSGYGLGLGVKSTCGVLMASISALGFLHVAGRAHATKDFTQLCAAYVAAFEDRLKAQSCADLRLRYVKEESRCLETVLLAADCLEDFLKTHPPKEDLCLKP